MTEPQKYFYRGQDAETLTRDELLVAFKSAVDELERHRQWSRDVADTNRAIRDAEQALGDRKRRLGWPPG